MCRVNSGYTVPDEGLLVSRTGLSGSMAADTFTRSTTYKFIVQVEVAMSCASRDNNVLYRQPGG